MLQQRALGNLLVRRGLLDAEALEQLFAQQREKGTPLTELLVQNNLASEATVARALAEECGLPFVEHVDVDSIPVETAIRLPIGYARNHRVIVAAETDAEVSVICADPLDTAGLDDVRAAFNKPLDLTVAPAEVVVEAINRVYERGMTTGELQAEGEKEDEEEEIDILDSDDDAPIIRWVNGLLSQAVKERASDIHIEPEEREVIVRYRVDGQLYVARRAPRQFISAVIARVKIMAGLNIAEKRLPQDGRISRRIAGRSIDVRVSTIPTSRDAERIVMRLLMKTTVLLDLQELGFSLRDYSLLDQQIHRPDGIILVTGPTGSGKTTTLYAALNRINTPDINILTAEDPVEYEIAGLSQVHVQPKIGLTFASALRAFLRQDPDVILVGEIRDRETAEIAMTASMTGHLVLSTLHTNDAASAVTRLVEMQIEPFQVRSTVSSILAQRLVRVLCEHCKEPYEASQFELMQLGIDYDRSQRRFARKLSPRYQVHGIDYDPVGWSGPGMPTIYRATGCDKCDNKGFVGRMGIYELLIADDAVGALILSNADAQTIKRTAQLEGMDSLRDDGARKVLLGKTTVEEVIAATKDDIVVDN
ncbi:MAG TPA: type II secretion system ATPase GspE [Polyangiaceae bacterium]|nr:type II secretion system ATPase GspE [Polyangiaceae bacterium]